MGALVEGAPTRLFCHHQLTPQKSILGRRSSAFRVRTGLKNLHLGRKSPHRGCRTAIRCNLEEDDLKTDTNPLPPFQSLQGSKADGLLPPGVHSGGEILKDRYKVVEVLGKGGSGITYKAIDVTVGSEVAIKCLSLRGMTDWKQLDLFEREAKTLEQLNHPNIPKYLDFFEQDFTDDRRFYIVQEIASGKTLAELVKEGWRASEDEVRRIAVELLGILDYLSNLRPPVVHRDVKPENIVLEGGKTGGRVYLVDFGGVQGMVQDTFALGSTIVGTYGYMAPEQFRGDAQPASDLYSFGATLLYLLSGRAPNTFRQERLRIAFRDSVTVSPDFEDLLEGLLEPLPEDRISARDALQLLKPEESRNQRTNRMGGRVKRKRKNPQPAGSRCQVEKSRSRLVVEVPPAGFTGDSVMTGSFAVAWNAFVLFWTVSAFTAGGGLLPLLFSLPFWAAGTQLTRMSIGSSLVRETLNIGRRTFSIGKELAFFKKNRPVFDEDESSKKKVVGESRDLVKAQLVTIMVVNGVPQMAIEIREGARKHLFGEGLDAVELEWLVQQINQTISEVSDLSEAEL
ncbi:hypothetical protein BSKO_04845 [Bryopsis sp. KO-2023]|nr:hypothetical protein BSKO_04845 [Bryopsis sp. KO-2023]